MYVRGYLQGSENGRVVTIVSSLPLSLLPSHPPPHYLSPSFLFSTSLPPCSPLLTTSLPSSSPSYSLPLPLLSLNPPPHYFSSLIPLHPLPHYLSPSFFCHPHYLSPPPSSPSSSSLPLSLLLHPSQ